jgi:hypothetical protein
MSTLHSTNDAIGERGEAIFKVAITKRNGRREPLFKVVYLGEKFKGLDFYVELNRKNGIRPFFFVQAKSTNRKISRTGRLTISVSKATVSYISKYPAPVFVVGIHEEQERAFISGLLLKAKAIATIGTSYDISTELVQKELYDAVLSFWKTAVPQKILTSFR